MGKKIDLLRKINTREDALRTLKAASSVLVLFVVLGCVTASNADDMAKVQLLTLWFPVTLAIKIFAVTYLFGLAVVTACTYAVKFRYNRLAAFVATAVAIVCVAWGIANIAIANYAEGKNIFLSVAFLWTCLRAVEATDKIRK